MRTALPKLREQYALGYTFSPEIHALVTMVEEVSAIGRRALRHLHGELHGGPIIECWQCGNRWKALGGEDIGLYDENGDFMYDDEDQR